MKSGSISQSTASSEISAGAAVGPKRRTEIQPLELAQQPDALLKIATFAALAGISVSTVQRKIKAGELKPVKIGSRCTRLRAADGVAWIRAQ